MKVYCCTTGHCCYCAGGGDLSNRELIEKNMTILPLAEYLVGTKDDLTVDLKVKYEMEDVPEEVVIQALSEQGYHRCLHCKFWTREEDMATCASCYDCSSTDLRAAPNDQF